MERVAWLALLTLLGACSGGGGDAPDAADDAAPDATLPDGGGPDATPPPPERCAPGGPASLAFSDVTDAWGLDVLAGRVSVADLDGDDYADVIVHRTGQHNRADFTAEPRLWPYRVLMNRDDGAGGRRFEDATRASNYGALREPVADAGRAAHFAVFADADADGDVDIFSGTFANRDEPDTDPGDRSEVLLNTGDGTFELAPRSAALVGQPEFGAMPTTSATWLDDDRDGHLDLFIGYWYASYGRSLWGHADQLLHGDGAGGFTNVNEVLGLETSAVPGDRAASRPTYGVTACDIDADGDQDLLGSAYGRQWNTLWLRGADSFAEVGDVAGVDGDANEDYLDNEFYRCFCSTRVCDAPAPRIGCDSLFWNDGTDNQSFRLNGNTFTTVCEDIDGDGKLDVYNAEIAHWHIGASSDSSQLLVQGEATAEGVPTFTRPGNDVTGLAPPHVGVSWNEGGIGAAVADLDNDGRMDVLLGTSDYPDQTLRVFHQSADGTFEEQSTASGLVHPCSPSIGLADFDRDGDLDVIATSSTARDCRMAWPDGPALRLYENTSAQDQNWVRLRLVGAGPGAGANRSAIGAIVRVRAGGRTLTRTVQGGYGHFGMQHEATLTVGLGDSCAIDSVEVQWPDAASTVETFDVRANYEVTLTEGGDVSYAP